MRLSCFRSFARLIHIRAVENFFYSTQQKEEKKRKLEINIFLIFFYPLFISASISTNRQDEEDGNFGSSAVNDIAVLQALSKRIHFGKFIAEAKFQSETEKYTELIKRRDADAIMESLTVVSVEKQVLERVWLKAATYGKDPREIEDIRSKGAGAESGAGKYKVDPNVIQALYRDWVMPLTKEVEVS
jgi:chorismate mutase